MRLAGYIIFPQFQCEFSSVMNVQLSTTRYTPLNIKIWIQFSNKITNLIYLFEPNKDNNNNNNTAFI